MTGTLLLFVVGVVLLIVGAELLVRGAARLAVAAGISPLVVGLTVVAFGTGSPELAVVVGSGLAGQADVGVGNVVGSNIANVLLILGASAAVAPLAVDRQIVRVELPVMIGASVLILLLALDGSLGGWDGLLLVSLIAAYTFVVIRRSRRASAAVRAEYVAAFGEGEERPAGVSWSRDAASVVAGLVSIVLGARWLVDGAVAAAIALGVSELVVGLTVVALGTSLPELATSLLASLRGERDIAVGNAIGSNLFNLLAVLGAGGLVSPTGLPVDRSAVAFDLPVMIAVAVACLPVFFTGYQIARWEGWLFLLYYAAYTLYLGLAAAEHDRLPVFSSAMKLFVIPLTLLTWGALTWRAARRGAW